MKHCYTCKKQCSNTASFCAGCGSSFDTRFCPRLHPNPVWAEYCETCGDSNLSKPHARPKTPQTTVLLLLVIGLVIAVGTLIIILSLFRVHDTIPPGKGLVVTTVIAGLVVTWSWLQRR